MQKRTDNHTSQSIALKEAFECSEGCLSKGWKLFFKLFKESTFERSRTAARTMKKITKRQTKYTQRFMLFDSLHFLARSSSSEMHSWPNSPLLVMLHFVDPDVPLEVNGASTTPLQALAYMADPSDYSTHANQLVLAKQLIDHGANVNAVSTPHNETPLHITCCSDIVTNLDFLELLLKAGANPNARDDDGLTPLMYSIPDAPGAAKFLLNWPSTTRSGESFLGRVRSIITDISDQIERPNNTELVQHQFLLQ